MLVLTSMLPCSLPTALDPQVQRTGPADRDDLGVQRLADPGQQVQAEVLVALLDPVDRALRGAQRLGQLGLGPAAVLARVTDQRPDPAGVVLGGTDFIDHAGHDISDMSSVGRADSQSPAYRYFVRTYMPGVRFSSSAAACSARTTSAIAVRMAGLPIAPSGSSSPRLTGIRAHAASTIVVSA